MLNDADFLVLRKALVRQYGEDAAQQALLSLWETVSKGVEVSEPMAFCRAVIRRDAQDLARKNDGVTFTSLDPYLVMESGGGQAPDAFLDTRDPESICMAKEILDSMSGVLLEQELIGGELADKDKRYRAFRQIKQRI